MSQSLSTKAGQVQLGCLGLVAARECVMDIVEKYRRQAEECEAIARRASEESQRQRIMEIAKVWRELAADRERVLESAENVQKPSC